MSAQEDHRLAANEQLTRLAIEIKDDLSAGDKSAWERLRRYRSAGEGLINAKRLLKELRGSSYGRWAKWVKDNFDLSHRQAQKYMSFANAPREAHLEAEEESWRRSSGGPARKKHAKAAATPKLPDDGSREFLAGVLPREVADEMEVKVNRLIEEWGGDAELTGGLPETNTPLVGAVAAIRFAYRQVCEAVKEVSRG